MNWSNDSHVLRILQRAHKHTCMISHRTCMLISPLGFCVASVTHNYRSGMTSHYWLLRMLRIYTYLTLWDRSHSVVGGTTFICVIVGVNLSLCEFASVCSCLSLIGYSCHSRGTVIWRQSYNAWVCCYAQGIPRILSVHDPIVVNIDAFRLLSLSILIVLSMRGDNIFPFAWRMTNSMSSTFTIEEPSSPQTIATTSYESIKILLLLTLFFSTDFYITSETSNGRWYWNGWLGIENDKSVIWLIWKLSFALCIVALTN